MSALTAPSRSGGAPLAALPAAARRLGPGPPLTVAIAAALCLVAFGAGGGLNVEPATWVEIALVLAGALLTAIALLAAPRDATAAGRTPLWGGVTLACFGALALLTIVSITWSVEPSTSWVEANRTVAYLAAFLIGAALLRLVREHWAALVGGVLLASLTISAYALLTHVFPGALGDGTSYARLREPFGYWNSVGLIAAMGCPAALWLGARREGHAGLATLAYPAFALLTLVTLLSYSRGSLLALVVGCALWIAFVPRRLRAVAVALVGGALGVGVAVWTFAQPPLSEDDQALLARTTTGHDLGLLALAMVALALLAGVAIGFRAARAPLGAVARRRIGIALIVALCCVPAAGAVALAKSSRGFTGSISHAWTSLVSPNAVTPSNSPGRLTATASVRSRYWREALSVWDHNKLLGVGAGGYAVARNRYRHDTLAVQHAHGYIVQTLADLGLIGLLVSLALLAAWLAASLRATGLRRGTLRTPFTPERIGLVTLLAVVVAFGISSLIDWTWFVPGNAVMALVCAGWLAARGPLRTAPGRRAAPGARATPTTPLRLGRLGIPPALRAALPWERALPAAAICVVALGASYAIWQPLRSEQASDEALLQLSRGRTQAALHSARVAHERNPLSIDPYVERATILSSAGRTSEGEQALVAAVRLQPANPESWLQLGRYRLAHGDMSGARSALGEALALDPRSQQTIAAFLQAQPASSTRPSPSR